MELNKKESKISDLFLKNLLEIEDKNFLYHSMVYFFFKKHKLSEKQADKILNELEINNVISLNNPKTKTITFEKSKIKDFIKNGGMIDKYISFKLKSINLEVLGKTTLITGISILIGLLNVALLAWQILKC